jgi:hypothetical protein
MTDDEQFYSLSFMVDKKEYVLKQQYAVIMA